MTRRKDITGQKFGRLTALRPHHTDDKGRLFWVFLCGCGKEHIANGRQVVNGKHGVSCGCYKKEQCLLRRGDPGETGFKYMLRTYKSGAKNRGHIFELTDGEFRYFSQQDCFYCGKSPSHEWVKTSETSEENRAYVLYRANGIDQIEPGKGYTTNNVVTCCSNCNRAKLSLSQSEFAELVWNIYTHWAKKKAFWDEIENYQKERVNV